MCVTFYTRKQIEKQKNLENLKKTRCFRDMKPSLWNLNVTICKSNTSFHPTLLKAFHKLSASS